MLSEPVVDNPDPTVKYRSCEVACEIVESEIPCIYSGIVASEELMNRLFDFFSAQHVNALLASYAVRAVVVLVNKAGSEVFAYFTARENAVGDLLRHINTLAVADLLCRLLCSPYEGSIDFRAWLAAHEIVPQLVGLIGSNDPSVHEGVQQALLAVIAGSREAKGGARFIGLVEQLCQRGSLATLVGHAVPEAPASVQCVFTILSELLERQSAMDHAAGQIDSSSTPVLVSFVSEQFGLMGELLASLAPDSLKITSGLLSPPLGGARLAIVRCLRAAIQCDRECVRKEFLAHDLLSVCWDLYTVYRWSNLLHQNVREMTSAVLAGGDAELKQALFTHARLHERIITELSPFDVPGYVRHGGFGHLTLLANEIQKTAATDTTIQAALGDRWSEFVSRALLVINAINERPIAGGVRQPSAITQQAALDEYMRLPEFDYPRLATSFGGDDILEPALSSFPAEEDDLEPVFADPCPPIIKADYAGAWESSSEEDSTWDEMDEYHPQRHGDADEAPPLEMYVTTESYASADDMSDDLLDLLEPPMYRPYQPAAVVA